MARRSRYLHYDEQVRVLDSSKVSDHHAILPTENVYDAVFGDLLEGEQKILSLLAARLLAALGNPCRFTGYHLELTAAGQTFKASAKRITDPGWKEVESWILGKRVEESLEASEDDVKQGKESNAEPEVSGNDSNKILEALSAEPDYFAEGKSMKTMPKKKLCRSFPLLPEDSSITKDFSA